MTILYPGLLLTNRSLILLDSMFDSAPLTRVNHPTVGLTTAANTFEPKSPELINENQLGFFRVNGDGNNLALNLRSIVGVYDDDLGEYHVDDANGSVGINPGASGSLWVAVFEESESLNYYRRTLCLDKPNESYTPHMIFFAPFGHTSSRRSFISSLEEMLRSEPIEFDQFVLSEKKLYMEGVNSALAQAPLGI